MYHVHISQVYKNMTFNKWTKCRVQGSRTCYLHVCDLCADNIMSINFGHLPRGQSADFTCRKNEYLQGNNKHANFMGVEKLIFARWTTSRFHVYWKLNDNYQANNFITKTCLYNFDPLKPHFYIVKLVFTWVYIIFLISAQKHRMWVLVRTASLRQF